MRRQFGSEYPGTILMFGRVRLPLQKETRFSRVYSAPNTQFKTVISKFEDGSAILSFAELDSGWAIWNEQDRLDFCGSSSWLYEQSDFPVMLRFVIRHGNTEHWSAVAGSVAACLPKDEAFGLLRSILDRMGDECTSNITQAIAATKHPEATDILRNHLATIWKHPALWDDDPFVNWTAHSAVCCIEHLLQLEVAPSELEDLVRELSVHRCKGIRESCQMFFHKRYDWIGEPPKPDIPGLDS